MLSSEWRCGAQWGLCGAEWGLCGAVGYSGVPMGQPEVPVRHSGVSMGQFWGHWDLIEMVGLCGAALGSLWGGFGVSMG